MLRRFLVALSALALACWSAAPAGAQQTEPRIALVIGNAGYPAGALPTALNDAGLVAEALRSIGFEIVEGANLTHADILRLTRDFLARVDAGGPDTLAFVYFAGLGVTFEGDNFLLGTDARLERENDIPLEGVRMSDLLRALGGAPARAKVVVLDASRPLPFRPQGRGLALGLEAVEPPIGMLMSYAAAPGTLVPDGPGPYGAFATAIAEMVRAPGVDFDGIFTRVRSRTHQLTDGRQTPWHISALGDQIVMVPPDAVPPVAAPGGPVAVVAPLRQRRPMREIGFEEAYGLAIELDTLDGYVSFVDAYPQSPYSERVWAIIRARREALAWMRATQFDTPEAYWTYLRRYPNGIYAYDAERRLRRLSVATAPPPSFAMVEFADVPAPLAGEPVEYVEVYRVGPPPPRVLIAPPPAYFVSLPPPRRVGLAALPLMVAPLALIPRLAPAPRRGPPPGWRPPLGSTVVVRPPGPAFAPRPPGLPPRPAPGVAAPPPAAPGVAVPPRLAPGVVSRPPAPGAAPPPSPAPGAAVPPRPGPGVVTRPPGSPPPPDNRTLQRPAPGVVSRPPGSPPPDLRRPPPPRPAMAPPPSPQRPAAPPPPPPRVAAPPPPRPAAPPPPQRPAAQPSQQPRCPPGKTWQNNQCK